MDEAEARQRATDALITRMIQALDLASEKNPGESWRQGEKNKGAGLLDIGNVARQSSDQRVCAGFAS